jgi:hypothetical protein
MSIFGWATEQRQESDGSVESEQRVSLTAPVCAFDREGAAALGDNYWLEVERATRGLVRTRRSNGVELRVLGRRPVLLAFDPPQIEARPGRIRSEFAIRGGLLTQRPAGAISFEQIDHGNILLRSTITGFFPSLAARAGKRSWTGALYSKLQSRIHVAISRRYFRHLVEGAR